MDKKHGEWPKPDDFESPEPHKAPEKSLVEKLLDGILSTGNSAVSLLAGLLAGVLVLYSGYVIYDSVHTQYSAYSSAWDLLQYKPTFIEDERTALAATPLEEINEDYRAWLTVYDTNIDYPVVQGENDDLYYAWHDIYKQSSLTGSIYLAWQNSPDFSDSYNLIYGHHMDNGAMFGQLDKYVTVTEEGDVYGNNAFYSAHRTGVVVSKSGVYDLMVFGVVRTDAYESQIYTVGNRKDEVVSFLSSGGEGGVGIGTHVLIYDEEVAKSAEKVVALSTCASADTSGRLVVFARLTKRALITIEATGYEGIYDGEPHTLSDVRASVPDAVIKYSIDDGATWLDEMPTITDVGEKTVVVRAESEANGTAVTAVKLIVHPKPVTVTVGNYSKTAGSPDPTYTVTIDGLLGSDPIAAPLTPGQDTTVGDYTVRVTGNAADGFSVTAYDKDGNSVTTFEVRRVAGEGVGSYDIRVFGDKDQGNYVVAYNPGVLTINAAPAPVVTGGPTQTDPPTGNITLTIRKVWIDDDASARPGTVRMVLTGSGVNEVVTLSETNGWSASVNVPAGGSYAWSEPNVSGYRQSSVTSADGVTTVTNTRIPTTPTAPENHTLTVRYRFLNGDQAAPTYTGTYAEGSAYNVTSPTINGYTATPLRVTGVMPGRDVEYTVIYIPGTFGPATRGTPEDLTVIDNYGTPLGVNGAYIDTGDCFE